MSKASPILVTRALESGADGAVPVQVGRHNLQKRRWRAVADDGTELAVTLPDAVADGAFLDGGARCFRVVQEPEEVVVIALPGTAELAAKIGWYLGNRHIPVEVREDEIVVEAFPTLTDSLRRIGIGYSERMDVLRCGPHSSGHRH
ncbi:MAG: hypothetical protein HKN82_05195 [Akkermansiaceae bacterium]|nr:hypothetical protein [Akkermansiaceae bacterium]NNM28509.1 hypothetical protein [Akkermansiaceae bacterium]